MWIFQSWHLTTSHVHHWGADTIRQVFLLCCAPLHGTTLLQRGYQYLSESSETTTASTPARLTSLLSRGSRWRPVPSGTINTPAALLATARKLLQNTHTEKSRQTPLQPDVTATHFNCKFNHWRLWHLSHVVLIVVFFLLFFLQFKKGNPHRRVFTCPRC